MSPGWKSTTMTIIIGLALFGLALWVASAKKQPWARSGEGQAADGQSKYDLTKWNDWYFERVKQFADLYDEKGTVLFYKLYMQPADATLNAPDEQDWACLLEAD